MNLNVNFSAWYDGAFNWYPFVLCSSNCQNFVETQSHASVDVIETFSL